MKDDAAMCWRLAFRLISGLILFEWFVDVVFVLFAFASRGRSAPSMLVQAYCGLRPSTLRFPINFGSRSRL